MNDDLDRGRRMLVIRGTEAGDGEDGVFTDKQLTARERIAAAIQGLLDPDNKKHLGQLDTGVTVDPADWKSAVTDDVYKK